jgi:hypothetical protein
MNKKTTAAIVMAMICVACGKESGKKQEKSEDAVGRLASNTAAYIVQAEKDCQIISVDVLSACAEQTGTLLDEKLARREATWAMKDELRYWRDCQVSFTNDYCKQLLERALRIERRKPPEVVDDSITSNADGASEPDRP